MDAVVYDKVGKEAAKIRDALYGIYPQETITDAAIASFDDGADGLSVQKLVVNIEPVQAGSGDPSPDNVRPISGWTGANVTRAGKNLLVLPFVHFQSVAHNKENAFFIKAGTYTISWSGSTAASWRLCVFMCDKDGNELSDSSHCPIDGMFYQTSNKQWITGANGSDKKHTITVVDDCYIRLYFALGDTTTSTVFYDVQLESGSTQTDFEAYDGETISVTFPTDAGTVYGGTLTLNPDRTGTLTVDTRHATIAYSGSQSSPTAEITMQLGAPAKGFTLSDNGLKCNRFKPSNYTTAQGFYVFTPNAALIRFTSPDPIADWSAYFQANPTEVTFKLATPSVYSLTAEEVSGILTTLYGTNNIWSDTGNIKKLTYRADLGKYIDSHITAAVANALNA